MTVVHNGESRLAAAASAVAQIGSGDGTRIGRWRRAPWWRLIAGLGGAAALWPASLARADTTTSAVSQTTPIAMATENPCTGEAVTLTGTAHYTIQYSETVGRNAIKFHSVKTTKLSLSGTAAWSGARYQNEQHQMEEENGTFALDPFSGGLAPYESTTTMTMLLIRQGDAPRLDDFFTRIIGHVTYTANGVPTVGRTTVDVFCR